MSERIQDKINYVPGNGKEINASILFVDIVEYSKLADRCNPTELAFFLDSYYQMAGKIVKENLGTIVDYYGDGFLAIFDHPSWAISTGMLVKTGFELQEAVKNFEMDLSSKIDNQLNIRLGGNNGSLFWGNVGISGMEKRAAIGDSVNFASRLEQANKDLNTDFLISETIFNQYTWWPTVEAEYRIETKGKEGMHNVYSLNRSLVHKYSQEELSKIKCEDYIVLEEE